MGSRVQGFKAGHGRVPIRWVSARDQTGTHRGAFFYATDPTLEPVALIRSDGGRRNSETTVQEMRAPLGLETTRGRCERTVTRAAPCLFGLDSVVALIDEAIRPALRSGSVAWPGKATVTFSDALPCARRRTRSDGVLPQAAGDAGLEKRPQSVQELRLSTLAPAAGTPQIGTSRAELDLCRLWCRGQPREQEFAD